MEQEELKKQCCTLAQSMALKGLGVKQVSMFYFFPNPNTDETIKKYKLHPYLILLGSSKAHTDDDKTIYDHVRDGYFKKTYSAFTAGELGEMIPQHIALPYKEISGMHGWCVPIPSRQVFAPTEAQARAELLLGILIKNKI